MTPDTTSYMVAGYAVFFLVIALYILSLLVRWRNLTREWTLLKELKDEGQ